MEAIKLSLIELGWILSVPIIAASVLWLANELYYRAFGRYKHRAILTTGVIGTPIHELAHAFTATLFGMKVTKVVFFRPDPVSQTLGYVNYQYNPKNFVHRLGMLFTGLAPLFFGAYLVFILFNMTGLPNLHSYFVLSDYRGVSGEGSAHAIVAWASALVGSLTTWSAGAAALLAVMIGAHSTPSYADLKGSLQGVAAVFVVLLAYWGLLKILPAQPDMLIETSVSALNHISTAILQLALLSTLFAIPLILVGIALNKVILRKRQEQTAASGIPQEEKSSKPLELSKMG